MFAYRCILAILILCFGSIFVSRSLAADFERNSDAVAVRLSEDFENQLNAVLKSRRPVEFEFVATVVKMLEDDQLPLDLVQSTFNWVRNKKDCRYPFVYFEKALRIRAAKLGIAVPEVRSP